MNAKCGQVLPAVERYVRSLCLFAAVSLFAMGAIFCSVKVVTFEDGGKKTSVLTAKKDPYALLSAEGIRLFPGDRVLAPKTLSGYDKIKIERGIRVELKYPGGGGIFYTNPATAEEIAEKYYEDFDPENDVVLYPTGRQSLLLPGEELYPIRVISPAKIETVVLKKSEPISYKTRYESEPLLPAGQKALLTPGEHGVKEITYEVVLKDGEEIGQVKLSEEVLSHPKSEVVRIGSGGGGELLVDGEILSYSAVYEMKATAYASGSKTATGTKPKRGVVAVDPRVVPLGTKLYITSPDGTSWIYGRATAEDTGGAIKGTRIDLFVESREIAYRFGVKSCKVYVLK